MSVIRKIYDHAVALYNQHNETLYNFLWRVMQIAGKQGVTFIIFVLCAKYLSPYEFGIYNYVFASIFMFSIFSDFGVSVTASRYTAQYSVADYEKLQILPFNSSLIIVILSSVICLVVYLARTKLLYPDYLMYCLPMLFTVPLTSLYDGIFRGLKKFKELSLINFIFGVLFIPLIYFFVNKWGIVGAIAAHNAYYLLLLVVIYGFSFTLKLITKVKVNKELLVAIVKYSVLVGISDIGLFLYTRADVLVLGHFDLIEEIGYYEIVNKIFIVLLLPAQLLATVVAPKIAQIFALKKSDLIQNNYSRDLKLLFAIGLFVAFITYLGVGYVFKFLFADYKIDVLLHLMLVFTVLIPFRYFSTYMSIGYITPSGNVVISTLCIVIFGIFNIVLDFLLIGKFGLYGVVYATFIAQVLFILTRDSFFYLRVIKKFDKELPGSQ